MQLSYRSASLEGANFHFATFVYRSADRLGNKKKHIYKQLHHGQWLNKIGWTIGDEITWKPRLCSQWLFLEPHLASAITDSSFAWRVQCQTPITKYPGLTVSGLACPVKQYLLTLISQVSVLYIYSQEYKKSVFFMDRPNQTTAAPSSSDCTNSLSLSLRNSLF